jgi:hypothetical protein
MTRRLDLRCDGLWHYDDGSVRQQGDRCGDASYASGLVSSPMLGAAARWIEAGRGSPSEGRRWANPSATMIAKWKGRPGGVEAAS